jgi:hypothetical protein
VAYFTHFNIFPAPLFGNIQRRFLATRPHILPILPILTFSVHPAQLVLEKSGILFQTALEVHFFSSFLDFLRLFCIIFPNFCKFLQIFHDFSKPHPHF